jgi:hypothetical protein
LDRWRIQIGNSLVAITLLLAMIRHGEASRVSALFFLVPPVSGDRIRGAWRSDTADGLAGHGHRRRRPASW